MEREFFNTHITMMKIFSMAALRGDLRKAHRIACIQQTIQISRVYGVRILFIPIYIYSVC